MLTERRAICKGQVVNQCAAEYRLTRSLPPEVKICSERWAVGTISETIQVVYNEDRWKGNPEENETERKNSGTQTDEILGLIFLSCITTPILLLLPRFLRVPTSATRACPSQYLTTM
jgi:hypothetical protein